MATIEIDGKAVEAKDGSMIIQAADEVGVYIPRFCYHKKLSIAANCRMCLVQVGEGKKPMPACATPVANGMKVYTKSEVALNAQKAVMEFLLINHPLDCPICDQGGQCELQDLSMGFGESESRYAEGKRSVKDKNLGPLIATEMTRCIHCTRCVRFSREIAGMPELGMTNRGEHSEITTYVEKTLQSEVSGNMIDVCPVGALTAKPSRFNARPWELQQRDSIVPHDCLGSNIHVQVRRNQVMKVTPKENEAINQVWLSDRDRFSYQGVNSTERLAKPMIKQNGQWQTVEWEAAFEYAMEGLQKVLNKHGAEQLGALISPISTLEEMFLLQKIIRGVGSDNIDHRLQRTDFTDQKHDGLTLFNIADLEHASACFLIGSTIQKEQPLASLRLRKMVKKGGQLLVLTSDASGDTMPATQRLVTADLAASLAAIANALGSTQTVVAEFQATLVEQSIATALQQGEKIIIILGQQAINHTNASLIKALSQHIAELANGTFIIMTEGGNSTGAVLARAQPDTGLNTQQMLAHSLKAYILMNVEPEFDCANPKQALQTMKQAEFVVALTPFDNDTIADYADVKLPITPFTETSGTFVNIQGDWQSFAATVKPFADARPGWKVLRVLGNFLKVPAMDYDNSQEVRDELHQELQNKAITLPRYQLPSHISTITTLQRLGAWSSLRGDNIVRRADALQHLPSNSADAIMNTKTAMMLHVLNEHKVSVRQDDAQITLPLQINEAVADNCVVVPSGFVETALLGNPSGNIEVCKC